MFPTLHAKCEKGHEWMFPVPKYWFSVEKCCPECGGNIESMKAGEHLSIEQLQKQLKDSLEEK